MRPEGESKEFVWMAGRYIVGQRGRVPGSLGAALALPSLVAWACECSVSVPTTGSRWERQAHETDRNEDATIWQGSALKPKRSAAAVQTVANGGWDLSSREQVKHLS